MAASSGEPGTAVAASPERDSRLTPEQRATIQRIRADNAFTMAVTAEAWGDRMTVPMRRAFAEYCRRFRLDVGEVDNLGGRPYRNGRYYERRIAEMRSAGLVDWSAGEHIGPDPRLDALATAGDEWAKEEATRRLRERIRWSVPEDATHAYVTRVKIKGDQNPLEGCDWITPKRMKKVKKWKNRQFDGWEEKIADPVGAEEPEKAVITRAWRRVGLLAAAEVPELQHEEAAMDTAANEVAAQVEEIRDEDERADAEARIEPKPLAASTNPAEPYARDTELHAQPREAVRVEGRSASPEVLATAREAARRPDPYAAPANDGEDDDLSLP